VQLIKIDEELPDIREVIFKKRRLPVSLLVPAMPHKNSARRRIQGIADTDNPCLLTKNAHKKNISGQKPDPGQIHYGKRKAISSCAGFGQDIMHIFRGPEYDGH